MINKYSQAIQNTLEQHVPLPLDAMMQAGQAIQQRGDLAEVQQMQTQTGLSSLEALAPGQAAFRDKFANDYKSTAGTLLDKYQGNTSNPEFIRDMKKLNMQYASDPRLQTIKQTNELVKQNQQIEAKMKAEGKLYINPKFSGVDDNGNLTSQVPGLEGVNTLEEWTNRFKVAHDSIEDIGLRSTNKRNITNVRKTIIDDIKNGGPESMKLQKAYEQQGLSPERARQAVLNNATGLVNQYGIVDKANTGLMGYNLNVAQFSYQKEKDREANANKLEIAKLKANNKNNPNEIIKAPSFTEFPNRIGSIGSITDSEGKELSTVFGSGKSLYGESNVPIVNKTISGQIYDISTGKSIPVSKSVNVSKGNSEGYVNVWVNSETGQLVQGNAGAKQLPRIEYINGIPHGFKNGKSYKVEERTVEKITYDEDNGVKDANPKLKTIYREATPKEAMKEMGYSNAYYKGLGKTQHGSVIDNNNKANLDFKFIRSKITSSDAEIKEIEKAQNDYNSGIANDKQKQLLQFIQEFDTRKSTYDKEVLPYFMNQSKTKTIVEEE